jgi:hypothetical protein
MRFDLARRRQGMLLGGLTGLLFGLVSQFGNPLLVPGVAFHQPPFGGWGNTLLWAVIGTLVGGVVAWSDSGIKGVLVGSLFSGLLMQVSALLSSNLSHELIKKIAGLLALFMPLAAASVPLLWLLRWAVDEQRQYYDLRLRSWPRLRAPLLLAALAVGLGMLWVLPEYGRMVTARMDALVRQGLAAGSDAALPAALRDPLVGDFRRQAMPVYTLEYTTQDLIRFQIPYALRAKYEPAAVAARFSNGWSLVCLYVSADEEPFCKGFADLEKEIN